MSETKKELIESANALTGKLKLPNGVKIPEFESALECTQASLDALQKEIDKNGSDVEKTQAALDKFLKQNKKEVTKETSKKAKSLKDQVDESLDNFSLVGVKKTLELIEKQSDVKDMELRGALTNSLIEALEKNGYEIYLDEKTVKISSKGGKDDLELDTILNNYVKKNRFNYDNLRTAILYRTSHFDDYVISNTDSDGKLLTDKQIDSKSYYEYLIKKSGLDSNIFVTINDIKTCSKLSQKDKTFLVSYKECAFDDMKIDEKVKQYRGTRDNNETKITNNVDTIASHIAGQKGGAETARKLKDMNPNEMAGKMLNNPIGLIGDVISSSGQFAPFVIIALIWGVWQKPKEVIGVLAGLGLMKAFGLTDKLTAEMSQAGDIFAQGAAATKKAATEVGKAASVATSEVSQKIKSAVRSDVRVKDIPQEKFEYISGSLESSKEFRAKSIGELDDAYGNKNGKTLDQLFSTIPNIAGKSGTDFYKDNKQEAQNIIGAMLLSKSSEAKTVDDLYTKIPVAAQVADTNPDKAQVTPDKLKPISTLKQELFQKRNNFRDHAKGAKATFTGYITKTDAKIKSDSDILTNDYNLIMEKISDIQSHPEGQTTEMKKLIDDTYIDLAKYYTGKGEIGNSHQRDYLKSIELSYNVLGTVESTDKIKRNLVRPPTGDDILAKLAGTKEGNLIAKHLENGKTLGEILSNPTIKGAWGKIYDKCFKEFESKLENEVNWMDSRIKAGEMLLSTEQLEAFNVIKDVQGLGGTFDFKERYKDNMWLMTKSIGAIGAGVVAFASSPFNVGVGGLVGSSLIAGGVTSLGMVVAQNKWSGFKDLGFDFALNSATFVAGGILFKSAKGIQGGAKLLSTRGLISLGTEMGGDVFIGAANDKLRSHWQNIGLTWGDALENNLAWALLPVAIRGYGHLKTSGIAMPRFSLGRNKLASEVLEAQNRAHHLAILGDKKGAHAVWEELEVKIKTARAQDGGIKIKDQRKILSDEIKAARAAGNQEEVVRLSEELKKLRQYRNQESAGLKNPTQIPSLDVKLQLKTLEKILPGFSKDVKALKNGENMVIENFEITRTKTGYLVKNTESNTVLPEFKNSNAALSEVAGKLNGQQMLKYRLGKLGENADLTKLNGKEVNLGEGQKYTISVDANKNISYHGPDGLAIEGDALKRLHSDLEKNALRFLEQDANRAIKNISESTQKLRDTNIDLKGLSAKMKVPLTKLRDWTVGDLWKKIGVLRAAPTDYKNYISLLKPSGAQLLFLGIATGAEMLQGDITWHDVTKNYLWYTLLNVPAAAILDIAKNAPEIYETFSKNA